MIRNFHFKMLIGIAIFAFAVGFIFLFSGDPDRGPVGLLFPAVGLFAALSAGAIRRPLREAMANAAMPGVRSVGTGPLVAVVIALVVYGSMGAAMAAPSKPKVTAVKEWVGKSLEEVVKAYPARPILDDDYPAINAASELRAAVVNAYPPASAASKSVRIRELWWAQGDYYLTFLMHFKDGRWVVLAATKWHKDVRF